MSEHRRETRQRTFLKGRIIFNNGASSMDCLVRDMSMSGARLALSQSAVLPEAFDLYIPQKERTYRSSLRWRRSDGIGITFADTGAARAPAPTVAPVAIASPVEEPAAPPEQTTETDPAEAMLRLIRRVSELEAENAALRQTVSTILTSHTAGVAS
ncbi:PilZ domain-containing protein [uncultured Methylobacterium sp.]|uniref:PilZ domain-containing protein n=1 Tax=uncultured Methylobacterium sp. TaxID=157278 RepID=UPI0035CC7F9A